MAQKKLKKKKDNHGLGYTIASVVSGIIAGGIMLYCWMSALTSPDYIAGWAIFGIIFFWGPIIIAPIWITGLVMHILGYTEYRRSNPIQRTRARKVLIVISWIAVFMAPAIFITPIILGIIRSAV